MASHFVVVLGLALMSFVVDANREPHRIRGATQLGDNLKMFNENFQALSLHTNGDVELYNQHFFGAPGDFHITAVTSKKNFFFVNFVFFGEDEIYYENRLLKYPEDFAAHSHVLPEFLWHGIDAATDEGPVAYFIKGCQYIKKVHTTWHLEPENVSDLSIPCNPNAAWYDGTDYYVLKGNMVWKMGGDINSPISFDEFRPQNEWELQPSS